MMPNIRPPEATFGGGLGRSGAFQKAPSVKRSRSRSHFSVIRANFYRENKPVPQTVVLGTRKFTRHGIAALRSARLLVGAVTDCRLPAKIEPNLDFRCRSAVARCVRGHLGKTKEAIRIKIFPYGMIEKSMLQEADHRRSGLSKLDRP